MPDGSALPDLPSAVARTQRLLALLRELTETGMELARDLRRELMSGAVGADIDVRFCRIAKAVRQLIALEARLAEALDDVDSGRWAAQEAERQLRTLADQAREDDAFEAIEEALREAGDTEAAERLTERLGDWYAERSVERDFTDKSVAEIVTDACKHLGIAPDPALLAEASMSQTLADAVRAYAAALQAAQGSRSSPIFSELRTPPPLRRPNAIADPRPPPA
jgi:hypothetical protein